MSRHIGRSFDGHIEATLATHPTPPETPLEALAHVLAVFADEPDEMVVVTATACVYQGAPWTGLRLGDLRRVLDEHAHALAERQRAELDVMNNGPSYVDDREWMSRAATLPDLIDPEVTT